MGLLLDRLERLVWTIASPGVLPWAVNLTLILLTATTGGVSASLTVLAHP